MGKKLYVGNLVFSATDDQLHQLFSQAGTVESAKVIIDQATGRSKGFAFVEMGSDEEAQAAISQLHEKDFEGRALTVAEARPQAPRAPREGGFGGGGGGHRGGGHRGGGGGGGGGRGFGGGGGGGNRGGGRW